MSKGGGGSGRASSAAAGGATAVADKPTNKTVVDFDPSYNDLDRYANELGISKEEAKKRFDAVYAYTGSDYSKIRNDERNGVDNPKVKLINDFLDSVPAYQGEIYRGFGTGDKAKWDKWYNKYVKGNGFTEGLDAMSSFTYKKSIASEFASNISDYRAIITVKNKSGKLIEKLSAYEKEKEVLVPKGTRYKIKSVKEKVSKSGRLDVNIVLEEV